MTAPPVPMPRAKPIRPVQTARPAQRVVLTLAEIHKSAPFTAMPPLSASIDPANRTPADALKDRPGVRLRRTSWNTCSARLGPWAGLAAAAGPGGC